LLRSDDRLSASLALAVALPVCVATFGVVAFAASELMGHTLSSYGPAQNLAEAAALGNASEVVRRLGAGEDPARVVPVRPYAISSAVTRATALEAAVWSRSAPLMQLFDQWLTTLDRESRQHLVCLAQDLRVEEIIKLLSPEKAPQCVPEQALNLVMARSKEP
jgi:hypothetical protein